MIWRYEVVEIREDGWIARRRIDWIMAWLLGLAALTAAPILYRFALDLAGVPR